MLQQLQQRQQLHKLIAYCFIEGFLHIHYRISNILADVTTAAAAAAAATEEEAAAYSH